MSIKEKFYIASDNIFADLGLPHPERLLARSNLMIRIEQIIRDNGWTQKQAAKVLGIPQSKVSCLMHGKIGMFSMDLLLEMLNALDRNVDITIKLKSKKEKRAHTRVLLAAR